MDSELCSHPDLVIRPEVQHIELALACFKCIERGTQVWSRLSTMPDVKASDEMPDIPKDLRYACLHWASHLCRSPPGEPTLLAALDVFFSGQFHYWLVTILILPGGAEKAVSILQLAQTWFPVSTLSMSYH